MVIQLFYQRNDMASFAKAHLAIIMCIGSLCTSTFKADSAINFERVSQVCQSLRDDQELQGSMQDIQKAFKSYFSLLASKVALQCNQDEKKAAADILQFMLAAMTDPRMRSFVVDGDMSKKNKEYIDEVVVPFIFIWDMYSESVRQYIEKNNMITSSCACVSRNGRTSHVENCSGYKTIDIASTEFKEVRARVFDNVVGALKIAAETFDQQ